MQITDVAKFSAAGLARGCLRRAITSAISISARTMAEWIAEIRKHPGKYSYASAGHGTPHHIFMELLKPAASQAGGAGHAIVDLWEGRRGPASQRAARADGRAVIAA